jgi:hypothetical protein
MDASGDHPLDLPSASYSTTTAMTKAATTTTATVEHLHGDEQISISI